MTGRLLRPLLLLVLFGAGSFLHLWLSFTDTSTEDEHVHLYAGMLLLDGGRTTINLEHPPLAKLLAAASLRPARPSTPERVELWNADLLGYAVAKFVYGNRLPICSILNWGRIPFAVLTIALAVIMFWFGQRVFGMFAAALAAALTLFSPLFLAVGHLVHTDLPVTFFVTAAWLCGLRWIDRNKVGWAIGTGALFGLALLTKYSALVFVGLFVAMAVFAAARRAQVLLIVLVAFAVLWGGMLVAYRALDQPYAEQIARTTSRVNPFLELPFLRPLGLYALGIQTFLIRGGMAVNYFAGEFSIDGWRSYFPVAFTLKTPLAVLLLMAIAVATRLRRLDRADWFLLAPVTVYLVASLFSSYNIGARHLLPIYPFLHLFVARAVGRRTGLTLGAIALVESLLVFPHPMGFFNLLAGPRDTAAFTLSDSNVDWGQDNGRLRELLSERGWLPARVLLMGGSLPEVEIGPGVTRIDPREEPRPGIYAVSRALYVELTQFSALPMIHPMRQRLMHQPRFDEPYGLFLLKLTQRADRIARLGNSIDVYEVRPSPASSRSADR